MIRYFCPRWGSEQMPWPEFCSRVSDAGYDGIEYAIPSDITTSALDSIWKAIDRFDLDIIIQHYDTHEADFSRHHDQFADWLNRMTVYPHVRLNSQTGRDLFSFEQNRALLQLGSGFCACHEIHRGKSLFAAHASRPYLEKLSKLRLTLDLSHWVCVAESWLEDQKKTVDLALSRTDHIHARVGFPEGPQIGDPRAPEWKDALSRHLNWWDRVTPKDFLTITPEFGPYPYMQQMPHTRKPLADQWEVNCYMLNLLKERYGK